MARTYTVEQARIALSNLRPTIEELITVRADAAELDAALRLGVPSELGGLPELKAAEAKLDELLTTIAVEDVQIKGLAPLLLDFPADLEGTEVMLCWLEGDPELGWYHRADLGFLGRRRLP